MGGEDRSPPGKMAGPVLLLTSLVAIVFLQTVWHSFITFDDNVYVYDNPMVVRGITQESVSWALTTFYQLWHPLTWLSHLLDVTLFGLNPAGHHFNNVLLHGSSTILLYFLLIKMTGAPWKSLIVAALFAVHPLRAESVAWVSERKDVLGSFFALASIYVYTVYRYNGLTRVYWFSVLLFALSLMSKPIMVMLPFVLLIMDWWPLCRWRSFGELWPLLREKIPFYLLSLVFGILTIVAQYKNASFATPNLMPLSYRASHAAVALWHGVIKTALPTNLSFYYPFNFNQSTQTAISGALAGLLVTVLAIRWRTRIPELFWGWFWYLAIILPVIGIIPMADRYSYLSTIGLLVAVVWTGDRVAGSRLPRHLIAVISVVVVLAYGGVGYRQVSFWQDSLTLYLQALKADPGNYMAMTQLGDHFAMNERCDDAIPYYRESLRIYPLQANTSNNLGACLTKNGKPGDGIVWLMEAIKLDPAMSDAYLNMGNALQMQGDNAGARDAYAMGSRLAAAEKGVMWK